MSRRDPERDELDRAERELELELDSAILILSTCMTGFGGYPGRACLIRKLREPASNRLTKAEAITAIRVKTVGRWLVTAAPCMVDTKIDLDPGILHTFAFLNIHKHLR